MQRSPDDLPEPSFATSGAPTTWPSNQAPLATASAHALAPDAPVNGTGPTFAASDSSPALATFDYATLRELEAAGFGFESTALGLLPANGTTHDNAALKTDPGYASIVKLLAKDLDEFAASDQRAGVGMKFAHRLFDKRWLTSSKFHYELVAIVHRVDRRAFAPATCGELRMVYRLAYRSQVGDKPVASRVPMTVNVVRFINDSGCQRWLAAMHRVDEREQLNAAARWTADGAPLSAQLLALTSPKSVEVNLQSVRWPSTVRPNMAGHAEYLLRVFQRTEATGPFRVAALENTPDVARLKREPRLRQEFSGLVVCARAEPRHRPRHRSGSRRIPSHTCHERCATWPGAPRQPSFLRASVRQLGRPIGRGSDVA